MHTKQQKNIVCQALTEMVGAMAQGRLNVKWIGRKIDLIDIIHTAFLKQTILEPSGRIARLSFLIERIFNNQGMYIPHNPRNSIDKLRARRYTPTVAERVANALFSNDNTDTHADTHDITLDITINIMQRLELIAVGCEL